MEVPSHLEQFLQEQAATGQLDSEGVFTLAREEALRKLAEFQLPFREAWVLKIIQSAVATSDVAPIQVALCDREARFTFQGSELSLESVEREFYNPEPSGSQSLRHLLSALWAVGIKEKWPFELSIPRLGGALIWDGTQLHRTKINESNKACCLTVSQRNQESSGLGWIKTAITRGSFNADVLKAIVRWCYTCPVPLTVDGRRVDSLYGCPTHGPTTKDYPLAIGFGGGNIPPLPIPPGTFEAIPEPKDTRKFWTFEPQEPQNARLYRKIGDKALKLLPSQTAAAVPFLLTIHQEWEKHGNTNSWRDRSEHSQVNWVRDGVVVEEERIGDFQSPCSVAIFLNSEGLQSDLTSLRLARSPQRQRRFALAKTSVAYSLSRHMQPFSSSCSESIKESELKGRYVAGGVALLGLTTFWLAFPLGAVILGAGGLTAKGAGNEQRRAVNDLKAKISHLSKKLQE